MRFTISLYSPLFQDIIHSWRTAIQQFDVMIQYNIYLVPIDSHHESYIIRRYALT